jgi:hypothetical protein
LFKIKAKITVFTIAIFAPDQIELQGRKHSLGVLVV